MNWLFGDNQADRDESDQQCEELRSGNAHYSTPREDAILIAILAIILAALVAALAVCVHYAPAIDAWRLP